MQKTFRLAHVSDVHLPNVTGFWPQHWNLKRALGFINWQRKRRFIHRWETIDLLLEDLKQQKCDHIAVSGDLANIGLPSELSAALEWLQRLGRPEDVSVIPGNHDIYCRLLSDIGTARWQTYMRAEVGSSSSSTSTDEVDFPYIRRFGSIVLVGVNSAVPTAPGIASGEVGAAQIERLRNILQQLTVERVCRAVMVHHPPLPGLASRRRAMRDAAEFERMLQDVGADLVIHGHNHRSMLSECAHEDGTIPVIGVPSFSTTPGLQYGEPAAYNIYEINKASEGYAITLIQRGLKPDADGVIELRNELISEPMHKQS
ncbi:MAG: metallophosphoesterase [Pseudomonadota bacterium]